MQKEHDDANRLLTIIAAIAVGGLLIGGLIGFAIKSLLPVPEVAQPAIRSIGNNTVYLLAVWDAFDNDELAALVPGLAGDYNHASFLAFDERGNMHYVVTFYPPATGDMTTVAIHEFTVSDPRLIRTVKYVGELSGTVYIWFGKAGCWIFAPYKHNPSPPAGCAF